MIYHHPPNSSPGYPKLSSSRFDLLLGFRVAIDPWIPDELVQPVITSVPVFLGFIEVFR